MRLTDEQIGAELLALRPTPDASFAAALDRRAAAGFSAAERKAGDRELSWRVLTPVLAGLMAIAVIAFVVSNSNKSELARSGGGADFSAPATKPAGGEISKSIQQQAVPPQTAVPPTTPNSRPRNGQPQVQELSASLGLSTDPDKVQGAADGVVDVTARYDGLVDSSEVHIGGSNSNAAFTLRIPAVHLRDALDDMSGLGRVTLRDEGSANVTGAYVDAGKGFRDARAKVNSLLEQLRSASSPTEADAIRQQLVTARQELVAARTALRGLKQRVTYAPVSVQIRADGDGSWSIGDATDDAVGMLQAIAGAALITLAVVVPLTALLALGWFGARELSRRRREATLDR
jgi:hypothetical protein